MRPYFRVLAVAAVAVAAGLILALVRIGGSVSFDFPVHLITSGWEQQTLFDIWLFVNDEPLYRDPSRVPYYSAFYNWLFYWFYGPLTAATLSLTGLNEAWLPTIGRFVNLASVPIGAAAAYACFRTLARGPGRGLAAAFAVLLMTGPLVGFWIFTVRPDLWALTFEMLAVLVVMRLRERHGLWAVAAAALLCYAAWSFKHGNILAAGAIFLFLASRRQFGAAALFAGISVAALATTILIASPYYLPSLWRVVLPFDPMTGWRNFLNFSVKSLPQLLPLGILAASLVASPGLRRRLIADDALLLSAIGVVVSFILTPLGASKEGASESYYFTASFFAVAFVLAGWRAAADAGFDGVARRMLAAMGVGWAVHLVAVGGVLAGLWGVTSLMFIHESNDKGAQCLADLPGPVFAQDRYLALPWLNRARPIFFLSYNYALDRAAGMDFEGGGVGNLITNGYFGALVLVTGLTEFDGAPLSGKYRAAPISCGSWTVYLRRED